MKNKKYITIAICIVALLVVLAVLICVAIGMRQGNSTGSTDGTDSQNSSDYTQGSETSPTNMDVTQPTEEMPATTVPPTTPVTEPITEPTTAPTTEPVVKPTEPVRSGLQLPYMIPGTELVLEAINPYTGVFLEDGSDVEVQNIYTVVIRNRSSNCAEYIDLTISREDGKKLNFVASAIEAGATVVIMETNATAFEVTEYTSCTARVASLEQFTLSENSIHFKEDANGALVVTNIGDADIPCVRIFYKFYMSDVGVYVGGITYTAKVIDLAKGESKVVMPSHYAQENSKIVMIKVYDTVD